MVLLADANELSVWKEVKELARVDEDDIFDDDDDKEAHFPKPGWQRAP